MKTSLLRHIALPVAAVALAACGGGTQQPASTTQPADGGTIQISGAGATFPNPIYSKWTSEYNKLHPNVRINYQSIGSGGGIRQLLNMTVFFGATDGPMTGEPGVTDEMKFTGPVLADIYLGKVKKWNDSAIVKLNPGVKLPATDITIVHRSDGSGTTYIWVDYLSKVSPEFKTKVGVNTSVNWPVGVGGKGNEGVTGLVSQTPGSLGYVELIYALQNKIPFGSVQNDAGEFVKASEDAVTKAAAVAAANMPADFRVSITNAPGAGVYPISSFTWILLYENPTDKAMARTMLDFMHWALSEGQKFAPDLGYAPLPESVVKLEEAALQKIQVS